MKKLLLILGLLLPLVLFGQAPAGGSYFRYILKARGGIWVGDTATASGSIKIDSLTEADGLFKMYNGATRLKNVSEYNVHNILDYGAIADGETSIATALQSAIDSAYANVVISGDYYTGYAGKVLIPPGKYYLDTCIYLSSYLEIEFSRASIIRFPADYDGCVFTNKLPGRCRDNYVHGGIFILPTLITADFARFNSGDAVSDYVQYNRFSSMVIRNTKYGFLLEDTGASGWLTAFWVDNISFDGGKTAVKMDGAGSGSSFHNLTYQCRANTDTIYYVGCGSSTFSDIMTWDFSAASNPIEFYLPAGSLRNKIENTNSEYLVDLGTQNTINGYGRYQSTYFDVNMVQDSSATSGKGYLYFNKKKTGETIAGDNVRVGDDLGAIVFRGWHTDSYYNGAMIMAELNNTPGASDMPTVLNFYTATDGSSTMTERLNISYYGIRALMNVTPMTGYDLTLGETNREWGGIYLDSASYINFHAGDVTLTHSNNRLTLAGGDLVIPGLTVGQLATAVKIDSMKTFDSKIAAFVGADTTSMYVPITDRVDISTITTIPTIFTAAADTTGVTPGKVGDIFVDTSAGKVYISKGNARGDWLILNFIFLLAIIRRKRWLKN